MGIGRIRILSLIGVLAFSAGVAADDSVVEFIDAQISQAWQDNEIVPSDPATPEEWHRRIYLDVAGRIPTVQEVEQYLDDESPRRNSELIDRLLESSDYMRHFTAVWSNACIGRGNQRRVNRPAMEKFFRAAFAKNRPWNEVVADLVTAEGHFEENGAVNYILAQTQMRDEGVQLTAKTTRLFLGLQVQCTQCHNHPFNDWQQSQFWEFNSFFRQVRRIDHEKQENGRRVDDFSEVVRGDFEGPVYFEKRNGLMKVAFPTFQGRKIEPDAEDRRGQFGKLLQTTDDDQPPLIAQAFVNRTWAQFFGYGFTRPVDDMGDHNLPTHPELLNRLASDFASSNYDVKQLIRWIVSCEAYSLSSQIGKKNAIDDPLSGEIPLFSRMYLKSMEAEQLYDSLIVATQANESGAGSWADQEARRRRWMQQFIVAFDTDEADEATTFNGTIPQALMLMNSELTEKAVNADRGSFLFELLSEPGSPSRRIRKLYLASLGRPPTRQELSRIQKRFNAYPEDAQVAAYQDLFWALLNSNEFILVH